MRIKNNFGLFRDEQTLPKEKIELNFLKKGDSDKKIALTRALFEIKIGSRDALNIAIGWLKKADQEIPQSLRDLKTFSISAVRDEEFSKKFEKLQKAALIEIRESLENA